MDVDSKNWLYLKNDLLELIDFLHAGKDSR